MVRVAFGKRLRSLRKKSGLGIKQVAPNLGITYTYLSKLENEEKKPSEDLVRRMARYYGEDPNQLLLASGRIPREVLAALQSDPQAAVEFLKETLARKRNT